MNEPLSNKNLVVYTTLALIIGAVGMNLGMQFMSGQSDDQAQSANDSKSSYDTGYQAGFTAARKLVEESSVGNVFKSPEEMRTVAGTVTAVDGNKLTIHMNSSNPFDDKALLDRTVTLDTATTFTRVAVTVDKENKEKPISYINNPANQADVKVGGYISVITEDNVKLLKEFTAKEVQILK